MSGNRIGSDPLFVGLTRPAMILGVSLNYALLNFMICAMFFIQKPSIYIMLLSGVVHMVGYILYFGDPRFLELYLNYASRCSQCPNKGYYDQKHSYKI